MKCVPRIRKEREHNEVNKVIYKGDKYSSVLENVLSYTVSISSLVYCEHNGAVLVHHLFKKHILDVWLFV